MTGYGDDQRHGEAGLSADNRPRLCLREVHPVRRLPHTNRCCGPLARFPSAAAPKSRYNQISAAIAAMIKT